MSTQFEIETTRVPDRSRATNRYLKPEHCTVTLSVPVAREVWIRQDALVIERDLFRLWAFNAAHSHFDPSNQQMSRLSSSIYSQMKDHLNPDWDLAKVKFNVEESVVYDNELVIELYMLKLDNCYYYPSQGYILS